MINELVFERLKKFSASNDLVIELLVKYFPFLKENKKVFYYNVWKLKLVKFSYSPKSTWHCSQGNDVLRRIVAAILWSLAKRIKIVKYNALMHNSIPLECLLVWFSITASAKHIYKKITFIRRRDIKFNILKQISVENLAVEYGLLCCTISSRTDSGRGRSKIRHR